MISSQVDNFIVYFTLHPFVCVCMCVCWHGDFIIQISDIKRKSTNVRKGITE
jgi:hypothetical protein